MVSEHLFHQQIREELKTEIDAQAQCYSEDDLLTIDLHCHDKNSDIPDEILGRILRLPETWLETEQLVEQLRKSGCNAFTVTNHNNMRSHQKLLEMNIDALCGAEFSCHVPDFDIGIHVLAYGFDAQQERILNVKRNDLYSFLRYACQQDIPTIWAHPLYNYVTDKGISFDFYRKMVLIFERFEVLNGQRDSWQNYLVYQWVKGLSPSTIEKDAAEFDVDIDLYCRCRYLKSMSGGSDSHMGIFSGMTGTKLYVENLQERLKTESRSALALEALRMGNMVPFGTHQNSEKMNIALLDYALQVTLFRQDPGIGRILFHKGSSRDKMLALLVGNGFAELRQHKTTMRFIELFHHCLSGKVPSKAQRLTLSKNYKPIFDEAFLMAQAVQYDGTSKSEVIHKAIQNINYHFNTLLFGRIEKKLKTYCDQSDIKITSIEEAIEHLELPSDIRSYFRESSKWWQFRKEKRMTSIHLGQLLEGLSFPLLASGLFAFSSFVSAHVLYKNRQLLNDFSKNIGAAQHPHRMLWLTDTFGDKNGVSTALRSMLDAIQTNNLPIDLCVCSDTIQEEDHLIVLKPLSSIEVPFYSGSRIAIPDVQLLHEHFQFGGYDRVISSTEGIMGAMALYIKHAFAVDAYAYVHTDWIMFGRKVLNLNKQNSDRVRRFLRGYYQSFDKVFVLNSSHQQWLVGSEMELAAEKVYQTAHWCDDRFYKREITKSQLLSIDEDTPTILFCGRLSKEKGIDDVVWLYEQLKHDGYDVQFVIAGTGPEQERLEALMPDAIFSGWVNHDGLSDLYSVADVLVLPSRFDTFGCVVLEALQCGCPVVAYKSKGPKDIIEDGISGYLANGKREMKQAVLRALVQERVLESQCIQRAKAYSQASILEQFMDDVGLPMTDVCQDELVMVDAE